MTVWDFWNAGHSDRRAGTGRHPPRSLERDSIGPNRNGDSQNAASLIQDAGWDGGRHG
jgi:hypothetical protein